ncbi:hypothetical protein INT46_002733 [Mucor plumbeus]|uniref:Succinate dehydrogenase subunit C n=1 Tax=Mucor plumbeus TaxID=97098 RepID=A0A8H7QW69_9FUNG|nr:hypothetical protein INT46_002733 [Mucor plumbeus]
MPTTAFHPFIKTAASNPRPFICQNNLNLGIRHFQATRKVFEQFPNAESNMLRLQRKNRPSSPHLTIYQPQLTWFMSSAHRITGCAMGGTLYLGAIAYLSASVLGYQIDTNTIIYAFGAAPEAAKVSVKVILALPFTFHASNGIRHLIWDARKCLEIKDVYSTGYAVLASTVIGTAYLATM